MLRIHGNKFKHLAGLSYAGIAGSSAAFLLIMAAMLFAPAASQPEASATEDAGISTYAVTPTVGISLPASIDFADVLPTPSGTTTTATADLTITTTDSAGYSLYLYSSDGDNSLRPKISSLANISKINATAGDVGLTLSSLEPNTWGYSLGTSAATSSTTYAAVPTDSTTPVQTKDTSDTNSANDTYTLSLGAKVDSTIASGTYTNDLIVAVVAEAKVISTWDDLTTMQEMTSAICATASEGDTKQLVDERDGKYYWVAKLKDGNCWMTQNLALDLSTDTQLTSVDSDVDGSWTPTYDTLTTAEYVSSDETYGTLYSWNLGEYVLTSPTSTANCGTQSTLGDCASVGFRSVDGMTAMTEPRTDGVVIDGTTYDAHYLAGNYYQWRAATAGTGSYRSDMHMNQGKAQSSICPKGWQLPHIDIDIETGAKDSDLMTMLGQYGFNPNGGTVTGSAVNGTTYNITQAPIYFVRSGVIYYDGLETAGRSATIWTSSPQPDDLIGGAVAYTVDSSNIDYEYDFPWGEGVSVRCVAK